MPTTQLTSFTRPAAPTGMGQNDALVAALLKQVLSGAQLRRPKNDVGDLGKAALSAFLRRKAKDGDEPSAGVDVASQIDTFSDLGNRADPRAGRLLDLLPLLRR